MSFVGSADFTRRGLFRFCLGLRPCFGVDVSYPDGQTLCLPGSAASIPRLPHDVCLSSCSALACPLVADGVAAAV